MRLERACVAVLILFCGVVAEAVAEQRKATLRGSRTSVDWAYREALEHDFTFLSSQREVERFVKLGLLVKLEPNGHYDLVGVTYPYVRPEKKLFIERLSAQMFGACGDKLVVTSAVRPTTRQPRNASKKSVHPTGMAVDLRIPRVEKCRRWLEATLLTLEQRMVAVVTKERNPPHYHVVVFPRQYAEYVASRTGVRTYRVKAGDTLSGIAVVHRTTTKKIMEANGLRSSVIRIGQSLRIPR